MIQVTRLNGDKYFINPHLIESIDCNPDTTITMMPSKKIIVKEHIDEVVQSIIAYRKHIGIAISDAEGNYVVCDVEGDLK